MSAPELPDISSLEEAASYLRIDNPATLARMARAGKIGSLKQGRVRVFPRAVLHAYVEANTLEATPPNPFGLTDRGLSRVRRAS